MPSVRPFGHHGTAKTDDVSAVGHELVCWGYPMLFTPVASLVKRLLQARRVPGFRTKLLKFTTQLVRGTRLAHTAACTHSFNPQVSNASRILDFS